MARKARKIIPTPSLVNYTFHIHAMTAEKLPFLLPVRLTLAPRVDDKKCVLKYLELLSLSPHRVKQHIQELVLRETRAVAASTTKEEILYKFHQFKLNFLLKVQTELLHSVGMVITSVEFKTLEPLDEEEGFITITSNVSKKPPHRITKKPTPQRLKILRKKCKEKSLTKEKGRKRRKERAPAAPMPDHLNARVEANGGRDVKWIDYKDITNTDVSRNQHRFYLPNAMEEVLTTAEKAHLKAKKGNEIQVLVIDHNTVEWEMTMRYWAKVTRYVLVTKWVQCVKVNEIQADVNGAEIWSFRKSSQEEEEDDQAGKEDKLCIVLNIRAAKVV